jgi:hypothetical protein
MRFLATLAVMGVAILLMAPAGQAALIVNYDFAPAQASPIAGAPGLAPYSVASNVAATSVALGAGTYPARTSLNTASYLEYSPNGFNSVAAAVTGNAYWGFTVTPDAGYQMTLTDFTFYARGGGTSARGYAVRSSLDNYATDLSTGSLAFTAFTPFTVTLGAAFSNLTDPVTFRMYSYSGSNNSTLYYEGFNTAANAGLGPTLNGTISAMPEPATVAFLGLGAAGLWINRRRRR